MFSSVVSGRKIAQNPDSADLPSPKVRSLLARDEIQANGFSSLFTNLRYAPGVR
jgi:hypothetical protein